jgi:hypothetical protein
MRLNSPIRCAYTMASLTGFGLQQSRARTHAFTGVAAQSRGTVRSFNDEKGHEIAFLAFASVRGYYELICRASNGPDPLIRHVSSESIRVIWQS